MSNIAPVTLEILECFLSCRYKAYLRLVGQAGAKSDYEMMQNESRQVLRDKAIEKILYHYPERTVVQGITLTRLELLKSPSFVLDASLLDNDRLILFDGLKRVDGDSNLGNFHYEPVLFSESCQIHETQRHRLSFGTLEVLFRDLFGLAVHATEIHAFKTLMATYYRVTYQRRIQEGRAESSDCEEIQTADRAGRT